MMISCPSSTIVMTCLIVFIISLVSPAAAEILFFRKGMLENNVIYKLIHTALKKYRSHQNQNHVMMTPLFHY